MIKTGGKDLRNLARELGVNYYFVRREFKRWCDFHGYKTGDFYVQDSPPHYEVPQEFEAHLRKVVEERRKSYVVIGGTPSSL